MDATDTLVVREPGAGGATLDERISAALHELAPAERQVALFFRNHRDDLPFMSAQSVAAAVETSNATVVRTAQSLGYTGLPALKAEIATALRATRTPLAVVSGSLDSLAANTESVFENLAAVSSHLLNEATASVSRHDFLGAVDVLAGANRVAVVGIGYYKPLAEHFVRTVRRYGRRALPLTGRGQDLADELMELDRSDALLAIAYDKAPTEVVVALDHATAVGARAIIITDSLQLALEGRYSVALAAKRGTSDNLPSLTVTLSILEALLLALAGQDRPRTFSALERLSVLRGSLPGS